MRNKINLLVVVIFAFIALSILLTGCTEQPNDNLSHVSCCAKKNTIYQCHAKKANGDFSIDSNTKLTELINCGDKCAWWNSSSGFIYDTTQKLALDENGLALSPNQCENSCNFIISNCSGDDGKNSCYEVVNDVTDTKKSVAQICTNTTPDPCVQNKCSAMICGPLEPKFHMPANPDSMTSMRKGEDNSTGRRKEDGTEGLVGKICRFEKMGTKISNILKKGDTLVNLLRMGIAGTFSDYDRARYYFPSSDYFSGSLSTRAIVDKFTNYLDGSSKLSIFNGNYSRKLHNCQGPKSDSDGQYMECKNIPDMKFYLKDFDNMEKLEDMCVESCNYFQFKDCDKNSNLITKLVPVSAPNSRKKVVQSFIDTPKYISILEKAYPTLSPSDSNYGNPLYNPMNYYHKMPEFKDSYNQEQLNEIVEELQKRGPAGGKVFECLSNDECYSGNCATGDYSRTRCMNKDGKAVDCQCKIVRNCEAYGNDYLSYKDGTRMRDQSVTDRNYGCIWSGGKDDYVFQCNYKLTNTDPFGIYSTSLSSARSYGEDLKDNHIDADKNKPLQPLELAEKLKSQRIPDVCIYEGDNPPPDGIEPYVDAECTDSEYPLDENTGKCTKKIKKDGKTLYKYKDKDCKTSPNGYSKTVENYYQWIVSTDGFFNNKWMGILPYSDYRFWSSFTLASQKVPATNAHGSSGRIITNEKVTWTNPDCSLSLSGYKDEAMTDACDPSKGEMIKFPLAHSCNLKLGEDKDIYLWEVKNGSYKEAVQQSSDKWGMPESEWPGTDSDGKESALYRPEKIWIINSLGDCQEDENGMPLTLTYGMCMPGGTVLSMAYQKVQNWDNKNKRSPELGYCGSANDGSNVQLCKIKSSDEYELFSPDIPGHAPSTEPDYFFLMKKINEYQSAGVLPILDMENYTLMPAGLTATITSGWPDPRVEVYEKKFNFEHKYDSKLSKESCEAMGGTFKAGHGSIGQAFGLFQSICMIKTKEDFFLRHLDKKNSAVIIIVDKLPDDCKNLGDKCTKVRGRIINFSHGCENCMYALETDDSLDIKDIMEENYLEKLKKQITYFSSDDEGNNPINFTDDRFISPWPSSSYIPEHMKKTSVLVIDLDFSKLNVDDDSEIEEAINSTINMSRSILQHVGLKTLYKLKIKKEKDSDEQENGAYLSEKLYKKMWDKTYEMSLAGIIGVLLPPLDNGNMSGKDGALYKTETEGRLTNGEATNKTGIKHPLFCAAQSGSNSFLHPDITVGIARTPAKNICECKPCTENEILMGKCTQKEQICRDNSLCTIAEKSSDGTINFRPPSSDERVKCVDRCFRSDEDYAIPCSAKSDSYYVTCTALRSSNEPLRVCDSLSDLPDCDVIRFQLNKLKSPADGGDPVLWKHRQEFLSALPPDKFCYVNDGGLFVSYYAQSYSGISSEPLIYPTWGANTTDCGRQRFDEEDEKSCDSFKSPVPVKKSIWRCS